MARRGFGAAYAVAPLDAVEVHLEDPLFRPEQLDQAGKPEFDALAQPAAAGPEKQVFRPLLAQRAGAAQRAALLVVRQRRANRRDIEAPVLGEFLVFAGDHRDLQVIRQLVPGAPAALQVDWLAIDPGFDLALDHQGRAGWRHPAQDQHQQSRAGHEAEQQFEHEAADGAKHAGLARLILPAIIAVAVPLSGVMHGASMVVAVRLGRFHRCGPRSFRRPWLERSAQPGAPGGVPDRQPLSVDPRPGAVRRRPAGAAGAGAPGESGLWLFRPGHSVVFRQFVSADPQRHRRVWYHHAVRRPGLSGRLAVPRPEGLALTRLMMAAGMGQSGLHTPPEMRAK